MDVWVYFGQREKEAQNLSVAADPGFAKMCWAEVGSDDLRGRIFGHFVLTENAYLQVHELVEVVGNHVHRMEYGYFLIIDGFEVWGYERDPNHAHEGLLDHRHTEDHADRIACEPISFKEAVEKAWDEITERGLVI